MEKIKISVEEFKFIVKRSRKKAMIMRKIAKNSIIEADKVDDFMKVCHNRDIIKIIDELWPKKKRGLNGKH